MIHPKTAFQLSHTVADIMQDLWHKKAYLQSQAYFVFRLEAACHDADVNATIYAHFLIDGDRWYFKLTDNQYDVKLGDIKIIDDDQIAHENLRVQSYRHYAFSDVVQEMIQEYLEKSIADLKMQKVSQFTIWNTFPAQTIYKD